jgi:amino acid permease
MFSLPYLARLVGVVPAMGYLVGFALVYWAIYRMYAALLEARGEDRQFVALAESYLPHRVGFCVGRAIFLELILVLAVYLILAPSFIAYLAPGLGLIGAVLFWVFGSVAIFAKLRWLGWAEMASIVAIIAIACAVYLMGSGGTLPASASAPSLAALLLPFGPLLFSFAGRPAIHEVVSLRRDSPRTFRLAPVLLLGMLVPVAVYAIFILGVLRLNPSVGPDAAAGLLGYAPPWLLAALGALGLVALWTSYAVIGANVREIMTRDLKVRHSIAAAIAVVGPLALYLVGVRDFLEAVGFSGGALLALEGLAIIAMWRRAFPTHPWRRASLLLSPVFLAALAYEVAHLAGAF